MKIRGGQLESSHGASETLIPRTELKDHAVNLEFVKRVRELLKRNRDEQRMSE